MIRFWYNQKKQDDTAKDCSPVNNSNFENRAANINNHLRQGFLTFPVSNDNILVEKKKHRRESFLRWKKEARLIVAVLQKKVAQHLRSMIFPNKLDLQTQDILWQLFKKMLLSR